MDDERKKISLCDVIRECSLKERKEEWKSFEWQVKMREVGEIVKCREGASANTEFGMSVIFWN